MPFKCIENNRVIKSHKGFINEIMISLLLWLIRIRFSHTLHKVNSDVFLFLNSPAKAEKEKTEEVINEYHCVFSNEIHV